MVLGLEVHFWRRTVGAYHGNSVRISDWPPVVVMAADENLLRQAASEKLEGAGSSH
jgi:hypothetical protein